MAYRYCTWALAALLGTAVAAQQPAPAVTGYTIFLRGTPIGHEDVRVRSDGTGVTISSEARSSIPENSTLKAEVRYTADWTPESFALEGTVSGGPFSAKSTFANGTVRTEGTQAGTPFTREHPVSAPPMVLLPSSFFGGWEALTRRVTSITGPMEIRAYVVPQAELVIAVNTVTAERMQIGGTFYDVRRYDIALKTTGGDLPASITATADGALVRLSVPGQALDVVRDDVASSTSRTQIYTNPGDEAATIPALGFNLGATLTRPKTGPARLPVAILLAGSGIGDRDGTAFGVPTLAQLAGRIADAGIMAVRFDKRGYGQSGGRGESATLTDYAEDVRAVIKWLSARKDVDSKRIAVVGHSEGAWVGMLAATREGKIAALVMLAGAGSTGADLILEQQQTALDSAAMTPADRESRVALQKQIHTAVMNGNGKGWEGVPPALRKQADTPWFHSVLIFDPTKTIKNVRQPMLLVHGALDKQVPLPHAEKLAELARTQSKSKSVELVVVKGVNHLLTPAVTGEVAEYATLTDRTVSADVSTTVTDWLSRTFAALK
jgi:pimeloyl-ACP methyl ester carboxylesterase